MTDRKRKKIESREEAIEWLKKDASTKQLSMVLQLRHKSRRVLRNSICHQEGRDDLVHRVNHSIAFEMVVHQERLLKQRIFNQQKKDYMKGWQIFLPRLLKETFSVFITSPSESKWKSAKVCDIARAFAKSDDKNYRVVTCFVQLSSLTNENQTSHALLYFAPKCERTGLCQSFWCPHGFEFGGYCTGSHVTFKAEWMFLNLYLPQELKFLICEYI